MKNLMKTEPALINAMMQYAVVLLTIFNINMTNAQAAALIGFVTLLFAILTRQKVTPNSKVTDGDE